ncbi:Stage 0 sporulation protein KA,oligopeptide ABC transporter substrate-binding protein OppA,ABC-type oligopeptide transport system, periplasmic component,nickel ABC transporter, nickel/metallophore periplasmic binding protein,Bacterial extracellular solute-binding proteins, family 5 Middle [Chlamydia poikilotherma]|uniref:Solute-binding protein family 5 domain-containing protein n=1 Tax=Chlamydia poikilotherma TaxID=1967783 RepID=A0A3B0PPA9_9CHLA|nr:peptide ABC transporter substrate-binding protein [Chlamydia poikilotherma]SYX09023.1 Stage 0 sporulation protein KA,oligopeptide ABC transporter substrate-binding protein OppA,ABC-type oligopeptide transport system, periplasmic component,nickel ABC transporter, nickel/metallophore periplasmic binding protein,Bacterial extracellular solute-binding proteins, family 5 Middle [Chlamydia poikilotherma]
MRKISLGICLSFLISSSLTLHGCKNFRKSQDHLSINMKDDPRSLDPREVRLLSDINLIKHIYEGLVQENTHTGNLEPALAESYSLSDDGKTYIFHLRQAYWSNGDPLTAEDFIASWKQVVNQEVSGVYNFAFDSIKNIKKIQQGILSKEDVGFHAKDDKTLIIELESPTSHFLKLLALPIFFPVHKAQRQSQLVLPIASSAFYPKKIKQKQWLRLEKNPYYYNQEQVKTQTITVHFIPDANTAALLFNQGKLHWQGPPWGERIPTETLSRLQSKGSLHSFDVAGTSWLTFNVNKFPLNHTKLRKALSLALDKESLVSTIFLDRAKPAQHLLPNSLHTYPSLELPSKEQRRYLAKKLFRESLEELNISAKDLESHSLVFPAGSSASALLVQMIREQWKDILGFSIPIAGKEFALLQTELASGHFSLATGGWFADFSDPMAFLTIFAHPSGVPPYVLNHKDFMTLLTTIQEERDLKKRNELISQASLYLETFHIIEPIYHDAFHFALNKKLSNFNFSPTGVVDFRYVKAP